MQHIPPDPLGDTIYKLLGQLAAPDMTAGEAEKLARAISVQFKALHDIEAHNQKIAQKGGNEKYLSYEDLPPPTPEERARFRDRLEHLIAKIEVERPISDTP